MTVIKARTNTMRTPRGLQVFAYLAAPPEIQNVTVFSCGVHSGTKVADAATLVNSSPRRPPYRSSRSTTSSQTDRFPRFRSD
jgi:hypothetical protein